jgi:hypothetical protein
MIGYVDLKRAVVDKLKSKLPEISVVAEEIRSGFTKPAFFVQLLPIFDNTFDLYSEKLVTIIIHFFSKEKTELANLEMLDRLSEFFKNKLAVRDRVITLAEKRHEIIDNVLQFKFDLWLTEAFEETEMYEEIGYTPETIEPVQELDVNEEV